MSESEVRDLHMVQIWLESRELPRLAERLGLPLDDVDDHYLVHCALGELFQDRAPKPYALEGGRERHVRILGYTDVPGDTLKPLAEGFASPDLYEIVDWDRFATKPMPSSFPEGMCMNYEVRACPVVRKASDGPRWHEGQELDAFLAEAWKPENEGVDLSRESIYCDWLDDQIVRRGGAELLSANLKHYSIESMYRRTQGPDRTGRVIQRPDATLTGRLEVTDETEFQQLLERGIGRHKSFGFGMIKLKRSR